MSAKLAKVQRYNKGMSGAVGALAVGLIKHYSPDMSLEVMVPLSTVIGFMASALMPKNKE